MTPRQRFARYDVRCYFLADPATGVEKADGVISVRASSREEALKIAIPLVHKGRAFCDMMLVKATARRVKEGE